MMPGSDPSGTGGSAIRRGGRLNAIKTATAAARAAVPSNNFFTAERCCGSDSGCRAQRRRLVGSFPGELRLRAAEVTECGGLLVDRPPYIEIFHAPARRQLEGLPNDIDILHFPNPARPFGVYDHRP